jgi:membrane-associated phospholipid phosphatase
VWLAIGLVLALVRRSPKLFALVVAADVSAELLADLGKAIVHRHRPAVRTLGTPEHTSSFPSGHTTTSFACALVLAAAAPRLRLPLYLLAAAIGFSRLYNGDHYPLDVVAGAVLGTLTALLLLAAVRRRLRPGSPPG